MSNLTAEIIVNGSTRFLHVEGYLYYYHSDGTKSTYWNCRKKGECRARVISNHAYGAGDLVVLKKCKLEDHTHAPNREEVNALKSTAGIKRAAVDHPEAPPVQIMRRLDTIPTEILSEMPTRDNIRKSIQRERLRNLPSNPTSIEEFQEIPRKFKQTLAGEMFLLYDLFEHEEENETRIIIFSTRSNLKRLSRAKEWHADGTFKSSPSIFFQLFTILGSEIQIIDDEELKL